MFELGGMAILGLFLVVPLIIGVASASKRVYQLMIANGASKNNALTTSVVGLLMLVGIMTSPLFLGAPPMRVLAAVSYFYFLFTGGRTIVNFFTGGDSAQGEDTHHHQHGDDCGCDHEAHGEQHAAHSHQTDAVPAPDADAVDLAPKPPTTPSAPHRTPAEVRAEIERRIAEDQGKQDK